MKRTVGLLAMIVASTMWLHAQDKNKGTEMTGWICNSKCVAHDAGKTVCDQNCTDQSGEVVFIDDNGKVTQIANPKKVEGDMGKQVKVRGKMKKKEHMIEIYDPVLPNAG